MRINLTEPEVRTVILILEEKLRELKTELIHTSTHGYKDILRERQRILQCLHDKIVTQDSINAA
jgi:hypothetical protein